MPSHSLRLKHVWIIRNMWYYHAKLYSHNCRFSKHINNANFGSLKNMVAYLNWSTPDDCFCRSVSGTVPLKLLLAKLLTKSDQNGKVVCKHTQLSDLWHAFRWENKLDVGILTDMLNSANLKVRQELNRSNCYCLDPYTLLKVWWSYTS